MAVPAFADLNKRQQYAILVAVPLVGLVIFVYLANNSLKTLGPDESVPGILRKTEGGLYAEIQSQRGVIQGLDAIIARKDQVEKNLKGLQDEIKENEERLPKEAEKTEMRSLIQKLAEKSDIGQVSFKSVRIVEGAKSQSDYQTITYQTEIEANLNGLIRFIDLIEKNPRFMTVKTLTIRPGRLSFDDSKKAIVYGLHGANMDIVSYIYTPTKGRQQ